MQISSKQCHQTELQYILFYLTFFLLTFPIVGFYVNLNVVKYTFPLAVLILLIYAVNSKQKSTLINVFYSLAISAFAILISSLVPDKGYDSWWYHQRGMILLRENWNPIWNYDLNEWFSLNYLRFNYPHGISLPDNTWTMVYPKASWITGATVLTLGFNVDSGKFINIIFLILSIIVSYDTLRKLNFSINRSLSFALLSSFNPVTIAQLNTSYVDGLLSSLLVILIFSIIKFNLNKSLNDLFYILCVSIFAANLKFTGLIYSLIILIGLAPGLKPYVKEASKKVIIGFIVFFILFLFISYNPYVSNISIGGNPFFPLTKYDIMGGHYSSDFSNLNRFQKIYYSLFYNNNQTNLIGFADWPFQDRSLQEFRNLLTQPDLHIGGFGPFFGISFCLSLIYFVFVFKSKFHYLSLVIATIFLSIVINPEMWWARYVPQMWLIPILITIYINLIQKKEIINLYLLPMFLTSLVMIAGWMYSTSVVSFRYASVIRSIENSDISIENTEYNRGFLPILIDRLKNNRTTINVVNKYYCENQLELVHIKFCKN